MKIVTAIIALLLIGVIAWYYYGPTDAPTESGDAPMDMEENTPEDTSREDDTTDTGIDASAGTDVGMEFPTMDSDIKIFNITGANMSFSQSEIRVQEGDTVTINFTGGDMLHDWVVDEFNATTEKVTPGETSSVTFVADQAGRFEYYCSVGNHRQQGMVGTLIVE